MNLRPRLILPVSMSLLLLALPLVASSGEDAANSPIGWVFRWLNFAIVFGGGGYLLAKRAPALFRRRAEKIASAIADSARAREEAVARLREAEDKLQGVEREAAQLRATARQEGLAGAERIRALAGEEAQKIEGAARAEIEAAERAARIELQALAARLAVERAEALLRRQITLQGDAGLVRFFVNSLSRSAN